MTLCDSHKFSKIVTKFWICIKRTDRPLVALQTPIIVSRALLFWQWQSGLDFLEVFPGNFHIGDFQRDRDVVHYKNEALLPSCKFPLSIFMILTEIVQTRVLLLLPWPVADPGFPVGGRGPCRRGRGLPRWLHFENFVCWNERIQTLRGRAPGTPLDPPM